MYILINTHVILLNIIITGDHVIKMCRMQKSNQCQRNSRVLISRNSLMTNQFSCKLVANIYTIIHAVICFINEYI